MRQFAIGDIHGCLLALRRLDEQIGFRPTDTVITLGDYIDRGPDSRGVIEFLLKLGRRCRLITLRGNHEQMILEVKSDRDFVPEWIACGGDRTLDSYDASSLNDIPASHWRFLKRTVPFYEDKDNFFVHGSVDPSIPLEDQDNFTLLWECIGNPPAKHVSGKRMICGHSEQRSGRPLDYGHAVCIDTFAYGGGWLTCLEVGTDQYWQANQKGDIRQDSLR